ncbi:MAG: hypothetical protein ACRC9U_03395 [Metamycoplasmataceae bacterium]
MKIEINLRQQVLDQYKDMSLEEINYHINNLNQNKYICSDCKAPLIIAAFGPKHKMICYFRAKNSHEKDCKFINIKNYQNNKKIKIGSRKENESLERALLSLISKINNNNDDDEKINIVNKKLKKLSNFNKSNNTDFINDKKITKVLNLPIKEEDLIINRKYKFSKIININKYNTGSSKTYFYLNNILNNSDLSIEIKPEVGQAYIYLQEFFNKNLQNSNILVSFVFAYEGMSSYLTNDKNKKISLWRNNSCLIHISQI